MLNPKDFNNREFIQSVYSGKVYEVIERDKKGMAKLRNIELTRHEDWNAYNNPHFKKFNGQLTLDI